jgi:acyl carrier protein
MLNRIRDILEEYVDVPKEQINLETSFMYDLGLSSLDVVNIMVAFEDEFGIEIPERKLSEIITVEDVVNLLRDDYGIS